MIMKNEETVRKEKKHKLVIEVGVIALLFFAATLFFTLSYDYVVTRDAYLNSKREMISRDIKYLQVRMKGIRNLNWIMDYVRENKDRVLGDYTEEEEIENEKEGTYEEIDRIIGGEVNPEDEDPIMQMLYVRHIFNVLELQINRSDINCESYTNIWLLGILDEHQSVIYIDDQTYENPEKAVNYMDYEEADHSAVERFLSGEKISDNEVVYEIYKDPDDGKSYYNAYIQINDETGKNVLLCIRYDWTDYHKELLSRVLSSMIIGFFVLLVLNGLLMLFIYRKAISPVLKVKSGVDNYMVSKDSEAVIDKMDSIKVRNEIGALADSFSDMAAEIDRYTEEIVALNDEKTRIQTELALATSIQSSMLPNIFPPFPERKEFDIFASMDPAKEVGGDFYDFFFVDEDHLCMIIADVSGKGIPAALFMMSSNIILKNQSMTGKSPAQILTDANNAIWSKNQEKMFVTVWLGILEISTGKLTAANGGHELPAVKDESGSFSLFKDDHGLVLGAMGKSVYKDYEIMLKPGDKIFVYTDGVPEASDSEKNLFGTDRMVEALNKKTDAAPQEVLAEVRASVDEFVKDAEQFDDLTMLCIEYHGVK